MQLTVHKTMLIAILPLLMLTTLPANADIQPYIVTNGNELDADTYKGFQLYRNWCARCHGTYGQGMVGPNLAESLNKISYEEFVQTVAKGINKFYVIPLLKEDLWALERFRVGRQQIYRYLKARADGAVGVEKPLKAK